MAESFPLKLLRLLASGDHRAGIQEEFASLKKCCTPRGIWELRRAIRQASDLDTAWFKAVLQELAFQLSVTNFDQELNHAAMRSTFNAGSGKQLNFEHAASLHLAQSTAAAHRAVHADHQPTARPGRPAKRKAKRRRLDAWNVFVSLHKPVGQGKESRQDVRKGEQLRRCSRGWHDRTAEEEEQYRKIAWAQQAGLGLESPDEAENNDPRSAQAARKANYLQSPSPMAWGIGTTSRPLTSDRLITPVYTGKLADDVQRWVQDLAKPVDHIEKSLPNVKPAYDKPCIAGACVSEEGFSRATSMCKSFNSTCELDVGNAFVVSAESEGVGHC